VNDVIGNICPYCQYPIKPEVPVTECSKCGMPHHTECWEQNGGCATFGCCGSDTSQAIAPGTQARMEGNPGTDATGQAVGFGTSLIEALKASIILAITTGIGYKIASPENTAIASVIGVLVGIVIVFMLDAQTRLDYETPLYQAMKASGILAITTGIGYKIGSPETVATTSVIGVLVGIVIVFVLDAKSRTE
jgi:hypothetical protein